MKTKGQKRAGRKRIQNIARQPSGERSRAGKADQVRSVAVSARQRVHNAPRDSAERPEWGFAIGRALMRGEITQHMFQAGLIAADVISHYYAVKGYPRPTPQAFDMFRVSGRGGREPGRETIEGATRDYERLQKALRSTNHLRSATGSVIYKSCMEDDDPGHWPPHMQRYLRDTLKAIGLEFSERVVEKRA